MRYTVFILVFMALTAFQVIRTQLTLTVRNELGNLEPDVTVQLFEKQEDYKAETNAVATGTTDARGVVRFRDLKAIPYFVLARKGDKDNTGGGEQTAALAANRINRVTIVIQ
jgi:hypothetical protein